MSRVQILPAPPLLNARDGVRGGNSGSSRGRRQDRRRRREQDQVSLRNRRLSGLSRGGSLEASSDALDARWVRPSDFQDYEMSPAQVELLKMNRLYP